MDGQTFASEIARRTPTGWRLTWSGDDNTIAAHDGDGLVVFASVPEILLGSGVDENHLIDVILEATEERIEWCRSWEILKEKAFVSIRPIEEAEDTVYRQYTRWIAGEVTAVMSANLGSHSTLLPDATLRRLHVDGVTLWTTAARNLERWFRGRSWKIGGPPRDFASPVSGPVILVSDDEQKSSSLIAIPRLIGEIAHEVAISPFCFAVPAEGTILLGYDTPAGRDAVSSTARAIAHDLTENAPHLQVISTEVFRIGKNGAVASTEIMH